MARDAMERTEQAQGGLPDKRSSAFEQADSVQGINSGAPDKKNGAPVKNSSTPRHKSDASGKNSSTPSHKNDASGKNNGTPSLKSDVPDQKSDSHGIGGSPFGKENGALHKKSAGISRRAAVLAVVFWLCVWQVASMMIGQRLLLASPLQVCRALLALLPTAVFWRRALFSSARIISGFLLALAAGAACAVLAAVFRWAEALLRPLMLAVRAVPVASFIILALLWLRGTGGLSVFISFLMVLPVVYENVLAGIRAADESLLEMAAVFRVPLWRRIRALYAPAVLPYFRSACAVGLGLCWKSGVAAEVIGISGGSIGEALYNAKLLFATDELLAWTVVIVLLSLAFERLFLRLLRYAERWLIGGTGHE